MKNNQLFQTQQQLLLEEIIPTNVSSSYGQRFQFERVDSIAAFRNHVPLVSFEDIRADIDKMVLGEKNILTSERVLAFFKTSGSMAAPKHIPVTASLMRQKISAFAQFWEQVYQDYPALREGKLVSNFSDSGAVDRLPSGTEVCSEASFWGRRGHSLHSRSRWPLPKEIRKIDEPEYRTYATARLLLQGDLHGIMCLNPSTLLQLCRLLENSMPALQEGLLDGSWGRADQSFLKALPNALNDCLEKNEDKAKQIASLRSNSETLQLKLLWPTLELVICWSSEIVTPYFKQLEPFLGGVAIRDYISQSSECMMAIPFEDFGSGGQLAYQSHFFEFIPEQQTTDGNVETLLASDVEPGKRYELVATTGGGLYRYRTGDCVHIQQFKAGVPVIEFLYRLGKNSSITGEKLTEYQIIEAAQQTFVSMKDRPAEFLCYPCSGEIPHYALLFDTGGSAEDISASETRNRVQQWTREFDLQLSLINSEYADKCRSGRLGPMRGIAVASGALTALRKQRKQTGISDEQLKEEVLVSRLDVHNELDDKAH